jgi:hypothetical protein
MVDPAADPEVIANVRRRSLGVLLGAATAVVTSLLVSEASQIGLISIPMWQRLLRRLALPRPRASIGAEAAQV